MTRWAAGGSAACEGQNVGIEAWRGVAAALVMYVHFWGFSGHDWPPLRLAHTGVDLFFVVSGFVFAPYLYGRPLQWRAHAVRRFFRIYPAYLVALAVYVALKVSSGEPVRYLAEHLTFLHVQSKEMAFYYNPPFWSLPAEVEFYIVLPLLAGAAAAARRRWGEAAAPALLLGLLGVCAALRWALGWAGDAQTQNAAFILMHHLPGVLVEFLLGALAWHVSTRSLSPQSRLLLGFCGLAGWSALAFWFGRVGDAGVEASLARGLMGALTAVCFALMVAATVRDGAAARGSRGAVEEGKPSGAMPATRGNPTTSAISAIPAISATSATARVRAIWSALAVWAGRLSYGVYLFHIAALRCAEAWAPGWGWGGVRVLAVALTLAMALAVYLAWENPWRVFGRRWAGRLKN